MKLRVGRAYGAQLTLLLLAIVDFCFLEFVLHRQSDIFREYAAAFLSLQWMLLASFALWCGTFLFLSFDRTDWPLIGLLLMTLAWYFLGTAERPGAAALVLVFSVTLGRGTKFFLCSSRREKAPTEKSAMNQSLLTSAVTFLIGLVVLLALAAWWHLDMSNNYYRGPRWMGLWDNPNTYGMFMGTGSTLAIGLLAANAIFKIKHSKTNWFLGIAIFMLGVGLVMSYSRGAWLGTAIGLLYLAGAYGKLKWRLVLPVAVVAIAVVLYFWGRTLDSAPWYVKRADLGRPSAQNRVIAWQAGLKIMRDHPLGVGWNNAVKIYAEKYSPPEGGPGAITTNDYLMLGTELGIPALLCFVAYVGLCYRKSPRIKRSGARSQELNSAPSSQPSPPEWDKEKKTDNSSPYQESEALRAACLAGALVLVVAFWFDGGLFKLPTAAMFWVLLELGAYRPQKVKSDAASY